MLHNEEEMYAAICPEIGTASQCEKARNGIYKTEEFHGSGIKVINMKELFAYPRIGNQEMTIR